MELCASGEYAHRYRRLLDALDVAKLSITRSFEAKIVRLEDHEGSLTVQWKSEPTEEERTAFHAAWESLGEPATNVAHCTDL